VTRFLEAVARCAGWRSKLAQHFHRFRSHFAFCQTIERLIGQSPSPSLNASVPCFFSAFANRGLVFRVGRSRFLFLPNHPRVDSTRLVAWPGPARAGFSHAVCSIYLIKRDVYKIGSSSRGSGLLWIRRIFSTSSRVYGRFDVLNKPCIALAPKVYRFCASRIGSASAHSFLWICMGLSTAAGSARMRLLERRRLAGRKGRAHHR
jgi:hypothetical protein